MATYNSAYTGAEIDEAIGKVQSAYNPMSSNRNLLDNPWFTVNQRGATQGVTGGFAVDRWTCDSPYIVNDDKTITLASNIYQDFTYENAKQYFGKTMTMSIMLVDGTIESGTATLPTSISSSGYTNVNFGTHFNMYLS